MNSDLMMKSLIAFYVLIAVVALAEKNYPRSLYWVCAAGLTLAVLMK